MQEGESTKSVTPLVNVGILYIDEFADETVAHDSYIACCNAMTDYVNGRIDHAQASVVFQANMPTTEPVDRVRKILEMNASDTNNYPQIPKSLWKRCRLWSQRDDVRLLAAIWKFGIGNWKAISSFVGNSKTRAQCSQRWNRALNPELNKSEWTAIEDETLWTTVERIGKHNWVAVSKDMKGRSDVQCRYRYQQLKKSRYRSAKTEERPVFLGDVQIATTRVTIPSFLAKRKSPIVRVIKGPAV